MVPTYRKRQWIVLITIFFLGSKLGFTQGFIVPRPGLPIQSQPRLTRHVVDASIETRVAQVKVEQVFYNPSNRTMEGTYYFPLPKGASVSDFEMIVDGKVLRGELLERDKARKIYEDIVRRQIDPALLEYVDHDLFGARIFPIPPHGERTITLTYSALLEQDGDLVRFRYPLRGQSQHDQNRDKIIPVQDEGRPAVDKRIPRLEQIITLNLHSDIPLKNIYSPSHKVDINRSGEHRATVSYEGSRNKSSDSFLLYYSLSEKEFGLDLITYRPDSNEDGYFMLLLSPKMEWEEDDVSTKDIVFILDTSGSMEGDKIRQAKEALTHCLRRLQPGDRFNIVTFSSDIRQFQTGLVEGQQFEREAIRFVDEIQAGGGTDINSALLDGLDMIKNGNRPSSLIFITDGLPTVGERNIGNIVKNAKGNNRRDVKIFTFGVGYDVNTLLLDQIALQSRSVSDYIEPSENIEEVITGFYNKVRYPVLTRLDMDYGNVRVEDVYPKQLPDLFKNTQITLFGRYKQNRRTRLTLTGQFKGKRKSFRYTGDFTNDDKNDFLPHLWATRKIGALMEEIRLHGSNQELKDEIIKLSKKHGVMSPFTSYLVQEDEEWAADPMLGAPSAIPAGAGVNAQRADKKDRFMMAATAPKAAGEAAVKMSKETRQMQEAVVAKDVETIRRVGQRTFIMDNDVWTESSYNGEKTVEIKYGSAAYMDMAIHYPEVAKILQLGQKIIFKSKDKFIRIGPTGKETMSKSELKKLFVK